MAIAHRVGKVIAGTPLEIWIDKARYQIYGSTMVNISLGDISATVSTRTAHQRSTAGSFGEESIIVKDFISRLKESDLVWDVGANIGTHSALFGHVAPTVSFEPNPKAFQQLAKTVAHNPNANIVPIFGALSGSNEPVQLQTDLHGGEQSSIDSEGQRTVPGFKASNLIDTELQTPTAVKVDVEGHEGPVIDGFESYLDSIRLLLVEYHIDSMPSQWSKENLDQLIKERGFDKINSYSRSSSENIHFLYEK